MKRSLLIVLLGLPSIMIAQTSLLSDNFDTYTSGNTVVAESAGLWDTWSGGGGTPEDPFVSNSFSSSPSNSMNVFNNGAGAYLHDVVLPFASTYTTGKYEFKLKMYVPTGGGGYFNLGGAWTTGGVPYEYGTDLYFNADGSGFVSLSGTGVFNYTLDAWNDVSVMVNLDLGTYEVFINSISVVSLAWGAPSGFGAADIFGVAYTDASGTTETISNFYVDDVELLDWTGVGIEESSLVPSLNVVPNPSTGNFKLNYTDMSMENATVTIVDLLGKAVYTKNTNVVGNATLAFDLNLRNGVYFITITDGTNKMTKKIIVKK